MTNLIERLDAERERHHTLRHPFYLQWSAGELTREQLAVYAGQYRHAVVALAELAARDGDAEHAREEAAHIELWDEFVDGIGGTRDEPTTETQAFVDALRAAESPAQVNAVLYAIESMQPAVSQSKLDGLRTHYGFAGDDPATAYFRVHSTLDDEHARQAAERLSVFENSGADATGAAECATAALRANLELLTGVEQLIA
ncbi:MAG TPA: iron-containing redox enzyme family protein [Gaiellaceae bacterium]|nr:iron-containing redox enzyme family protein [Gaiellaceae bacterium]